MGQTSRKRFRLEERQPANGGLSVLPLDIEQIRHHLELINPRGEGYDGKFVFIAIDDMKPKRQSSHMYGTLEECLPEIQRAQDMAYGIFVIPHETTGRKQTDIQCVRVLRFDFDGGPPLEKLLATWPEWLGISMILKTPRGHHIYCEAPHHPLMRELGTWKSAQKQITDIVGSDANASGISQPYRLAGTWHQKGEPILVEIKSLNFKTYFDPRIVLGHLPAEPSTAPGEVLEVLADSPYPWETLMAVLDRACSKIRAASKGDRWAIARRQAFHLGHYVPYGLPKERAYKDLWAAIRSHSDPDLVQRCGRSMADTFQTGIRRGYSNPPDLPKEKVNAMPLTEWADLVVSKLGSSAVSIPMLLNRRAAWKDLGTRKQAADALGKALRRAGRLGKVAKLRGRATLMFTMPGTPPSPPKNPQ